MIAIGLFLTGVIVGIVVSFWQEIIDWIKNTVIPFLQQKWKQFLVGVKLFLRKVKGMVTEETKGYSYKDDKWIETTTERTIDESEVPSDILAKINRGQTDFTKEMELEMAS